MAKPKKMKILDLGCGENKYKSENPEDVVIGMDKTKLKGVDVLHDADTFPYPFKDNEFDMLYSNHSIEHFENIIKVMEECHRILRPNGKMIILTPHFSWSGSWADITHRQHLTYRSFEYFDKTTMNGQRFSFYTKARFRIIKRKICFGRFGRYSGLEWFANKFPYIYEDFLTWIFSARNLYFELKAIK